MVVDVSLVILVLFFPRDFLGGWWRPQRGKGALGAEAAQATRAIGRVSMPLQ